MLPALTIARARPSLLRRVAFGASASLFVLAALANRSSAPSEPPAIADRLRPSSWAMTIPVAWLSAPMPKARPGDSFDLLAIRGGERAFATPIAYAVVVLTADDRGLVVQVDEDDALAIANARGAGLSLMPLLRSTR